MPIGAPLTWHDAIEMDIAQVAVAEYCPGSWPASTRAISMPSTTNPGAPTSFTEAGSAWARYSRIRVRAQSSAGRSRNSSYCNGTLAIASPLSQLAATASMALSAPKYDRLRDD
jgi:hypothetical protein